MWSRPTRVGDLAERAVSLADARFRIVLWRAARAHWATRDGTSRVRRDTAEHLDATRYLPTEGAREDKPVDTTTPASDPGKPGGSSQAGQEEVLE